MSAHDILPFLYGILAGLLGWPIWRFFHPWRCTAPYCGYWTWKAKNLMAHITGKHIHEK